MTEERIMQEAERWVLRMNDAEDTVDRAALERWLKTSDHAAAFALAERQWRTFEGLVGRADLENLADRAVADTVPELKSRRRHVSLALAASLTMAALTAVGFLVGRYHTPTQTYVTEVGQRSTVQLDDGSQLILNSATRLQAKFTDDRRQFVLKSGEAVFVVAQDPLRPFTVAAGNGEVTALGTRFQVRHEARSITVTLLEGRVAVDRPGTNQHLQLTPGERIWFVTDAPAIERAVVDPDVVSSWTTGRLKFKATPLAEVLDEVNRYTKTRIRLQDASLGKTPVYGVFDIGDVTSVVQGLQSMLPLEVMSQDRREIVLTRK